VLAGMGAPLAEGSSSSFSLAAGLGVMEVARRPPLASWLALPDAGASWPAGQGKNEHKRGHEERVRARPGAAGSQQAPQAP
jgi:hypothetical protein